MPTHGHKEDWPLCDLFPFSLHGVKLSEKAFSQDIRQNVRKRRNVRERRYVRKPLK